MGVFLPVAILFWFYFRVLPLESISVGDRLPEFRLPTLEGGYASFSDAEERTLLVFLSSKCPSCLDEINHLDTLQEVIDSRNIKLIVIFDGDYRTTAALYNNKSVHGQITYDGTDLACATLAVGVAYTQSVLCFAHPVGTVVCSFCTAWGVYRALGGILGQTERLIELYDAADSGRHRFKKNACCGGQQSAT